MIGYIVKSSLPLLGCCALSALFAAVSTATTINHGDFDDIPTGVVTYLDVTESSPSGDDLPLFDEPSVSENELDFNPVSFGAAASNGDVAITDGQLNFSFETLPGTGVRSLAFAETIDYRFFPGGSVATQVAASLVGQVMITEVNGVPLSPADVIDVPFAAGASFDALNDPTPMTGQLEQLGVLVEFGIPLSNAGFGPMAVVTAADVFLNNTLLAGSEAGTLAFIAKKDFVVTPRGPLDPDNVIPEPTTAVLAGLALAGFAARRR